MSRATEKIIERLKVKAGKSPCKYLIAAAVIGKNGKVVCLKTNKPRFARRGGGSHAEIQAIKSSKADAIAAIILVRVGRRGEVRMIKPCKSCAKLLKKYGVKIETIV